MGLSPAQMCKPGSALLQSAGSAADCAERPEEGIFILPCGYVDEAGRFHNEVEMVHPTGKDEEFLLSMNPALSCACVTTGLLLRCIKRIGSINLIDAGRVRDLIETDREYLILRLREMITGKDFHAVLKCQNELCNKPMDVTFSTDDFVIQRKPALNKFFSMQLSPEAAYRDGTGTEYRDIEFRLPTGADIEAAAAVFSADENFGLNRLLARCLTRIGGITEINETVIAALNESARNEIDHRMQELSPQTEFEMEAVCPECRNTFTVALDVTSYFFHELRMNTGSLEREIHTLALHYHWSEQEILSLPRRKRRRYIALIDETMGLEI